MLGFLLRPFFQLDWRPGASSNWIFLLACLVLTVHGLPTHTTDDAQLDGPDSFGRLTAFLRAEGATVSPALKLSSGAIRGVATTADVKAGDTLLSVPARLILSGEAVSKRGPACAVARLLANCNRAAGKSDADCKVLLPGDNVAGPLENMSGRDLELAAFLVERLHFLGENAGNSSGKKPSWPTCRAGALPAEFFDTYLKTLPTWNDLQGLPVFSAVKAPCSTLLNGTWVAQFAGQQREQWNKEWAVLVKRIPGMTQFRSEDYLYAKAIILTRTFGLRTGPDSPLEPALVPLADLLNELTVEKPTVAWDDLNVSQAGFHYTSKQAVAGGSELSITYGKKPNFANYLTYGFFFDHQSFEMVPLDLRPFRGELSDEGGVRAGSLLAEVPPVVELLYEMAPMQLPSILQFARSLALAEKNASINSSVQSPLPWKLERRAFELLHGHVEAQLRARSGEAAVAASRAPLKLAQSSGSCERYARLNNEPYGALLDFAEQGMHDLEARMGLPSSGAQQPAEVTTRRSQWTSRLLDGWKRQMDSPRRVTATKLLRGTSRTSVPVEHRVLGHT